MTTFQTQGVAPKPHPAPSFVTCVTHALTGLTCGLSIFLLHELIVGLQLHGKPTDATWHSIGLGLLWPCGFGLSGIMRGFTKPIALFQAPLFVAAVVLAFLAVTIANLFFAFCIAMSGYC